MVRISNLVKLGIISKAEDGWSIRRIALRYNINKNSVFNILKKWRQQGTINANPGAGRRRASNQEQDALLIQTIREHPFYSVVDAVGEANFPGSARTARRRVKETDIRCRSAAKKILLTQQHKERRVGFALEYMAVDETFWDNIIFTDEKTFQSTRNGPIRVYRPANSRFQGRYVNHVDSNRFTVNMWAWISARGPGVLWHIDTRLNSPEYISILNNIMLPSVSLLYPDQFLFQQDNCPVHTAHIVQDWFRQNNIHIVDWPSRSPHLNPIENVWGLLVKKIQRQNLRPRNVEEMLEILHNTWETIEDDYFLNLCHSMPRRLAEVVNRNGAMTKY
jgi:transposase